MKSISATKNQRSLRRRLIITILVIALLAVAGVAAYSYLNRGVSDTKGKTSSNNGGGASKETTDDEGSALPTPDVDDPTSNSVKNDTSSDTGDSSDNNTIEITSAYVNGETFAIRTIIHSVTESGQCSLSMKNTTGKSYAKTTGVQALANTSTCKGFNVPMSSLSSGTWSITVLYTSGGDKSTATKEVVINA